MSYRQIICLANSWKHKERCIAGIDIETGVWVRPVCDRLYALDGRVPFAVRQIDRRELKLLDILEIPLADTGNDFGFECENRSVLDSSWRCLDQVQPNELLAYCDRLPYILHNSSKAVTVSFLQNLPFVQRRTLQLVHTQNFAVAKTDKWRGTIQLASGRSLKDIPITDPVLVNQLEKGYQPCQNCFITVSLGMPLQNSNGELQCWKLIAGVIEL
jgi:hypothetical protein